MKTPFLTWILLIVSSFTLTGCLVVVAAGGAAGSVAYVKGELQIQLDNEVREVNDAIEQATDELELHRISGERDLLGGHYVFRNSKDDKITITSEAVTEGSTELKIRVGLFGDQDQSQMILNKIQVRL